MYRYIIKRLLLVIPTLIGAAALVFLLMRLIPGDICFLRLASGGGNISEQVLLNCHKELGLDQPIWRQFLDFGGQLLFRDFCQIEVFFAAGIH